MRPTRDTDGYHAHPAQRHALPAVCHRPHEVFCWKRCRLMLLLQLQGSSPLRMHILRRLRICSASSVPLPAQGVLAADTAKAYHKSPHVACQTNSHLMFHLISSHLISSHLISSRLISSHLISSHLISSHLVLSHLISSRLVSLHSNPLRSSPASIAMIAVQSLQCNVP